MTAVFTPPEVVLQGVSYALVEGRYQPQPLSTVLPLLGQADLARFLQASRAMGETSWIKSFRQWLTERPEGC